MAEQPLLLMRGIHKRFPGVHALDGVDFDVRAGEVHGLMGQNGAGKSTLLKVLTGVHPRDAGTITFAGRTFRASSPAEAQRKGISTVYQEVNLVPALSVAENLFLGRSPRRWFGIDWRGMRRRARALLAEFALSIDVAEPLGSYPVAIQQMVAIARALDIRARLLILDEPTASLDRQETEVLFGVVRRLKLRGLGIVFVTHFLDQAYQVSDRITVLRNGRKVGTFAAGRLPRLALVGHMLGQSPQQAAALAAQRLPAAESRAERPVLLTARGLGRRRAVAPFTLQIRSGEVLGFAGLLGSGRTEAARLLFGADRADSGALEIDGRRVARHSPRRAIALGVAFCPEDRQREGLFPDMSLRGNIALVVQRRLSRLGILSRRAQARIAARFVRRLEIATPDLERPVRYLSGGNQQKVILARWLACAPRLLIMDEPTRGIDVGAKAEVERLIDGLWREGLALVFISAELEEVVRRSHRILVWRERQVVRELGGEQVSQHAVMRTIAGQHAEEA